MANLAHAIGEAAVPAADPFDGTPYRVRRRLASGSVGEVFVVEHRELGSDFVAKLLHRRYLTDPQIVDRVRIEAQALGRLNHPNIVSVLGYGLTRDHRPYVVTEYLRGQTLGELLGSVGPLPTLDALVYACQMLWALAAAHSIGIVHRDIKPENLFLVERPGAPALLKVLDFSIARVIPGVAPQAPLPLALPTDTGIIVGTPRYISPEAALGQHADHRADIYGVAMVLYRMLTGRCPFDFAKDHAEMLLAHVTEQPQPPSHFTRVPLDPDLDSIVLKALEKKPEDRYQTAKEFETALASLTERLLANHDPGAATGPAAVGETPSLPPVRASALEPSTIAEAAGGRWRFLVYVFVSLATAIVVALIGSYGGLGSR